MIENDLPQAASQVSEETKAAKTLILKSARRRIVRNVLIGAASLATVAGIANASNNLIGSAGRGDGPMAGTIGGTIGNTE